jgi:hypothetical protein
MCADTRWEHCFLEKISKRIKEEYKMNDLRAHQENVDRVQARMKRQRQVSELRKAHTAALTREGALRVACGEIDLDSLHTLLVKHAECAENSWDMGAAKGIWDQIHAVHELRMLLREDAPEPKTYEDGVKHTTKSIVKWVRRREHDMGALPATINEEDEARYIADSIEAGDHLEDDQKNRIMEVKMATKKEMQEIARKQSEKLYKIAEVLRGLADNDDYGIPGKACVPLYGACSKLLVISEELQEMAPKKEHPEDTGGLFICDHAKENECSGCNHAEPHRQPWSCTRVYGMCMVAKCRTTCIPVEEVE